MSLQANDGLGEWFTGTLTLHYVINTNKWYHHQAMGSTLIGEDTGTVYRITGITQYITLNTETLVTTIVDVYHFVGGDTQFLERIIYHVTTTDGEPVVVVDHKELICK